MRATHLSRSLILEGRVPSCAGLQGRSVLLAVGTIWCISCSTPIALLKKGLAVATVWSSRFDLLEDIIRRGASQLCMGVRGTLMN